MKILGNVAYERPVSFPIAYRPSDIREGDNSSAKTQSGARPINHHDRNLHASTFVEDITMDLFRRISCGVSPTNTPFLSSVTLLIPPFSSGPIHGPLLSRDKPTFPLVHVSLHYILEGWIGS